MNILYSIFVNIVLDMKQGNADAERRLARGKGLAKPASPRMDRRVRKALRKALSTYHRPNLCAVRRLLVERCRSWGIAPPSRTTLYEMLEREAFHHYMVANLPAHIQSVLYNVDSKARIDGRQLAFYCFNYGALSALSFGASLPWVDLMQAARAPGWRPQSKGLIEAVLFTRSRQ